LPADWDFVSSKSIFLQKKYLSILENASPKNMKCYFIGIFEGEKLIATSIMQEIHLNALKSLGNRDHCLKNQIRDFIFRKFSSKLLILGNNMVSGQNAYCISKTADEKQLLRLLKDISDHWPNKAHIKIIKDFYASDFAINSSNDFQKNYCFSAQPSMVFRIQSHWKEEGDYVADLSKKYRDQFKRCRKKGDELQSKELTFEEIEQNIELIHKLYVHVAENAPVNTFFLPKNHFLDFKKYLKNDFILKGYYLNDLLVGFSTIIRHGKELETYFLGYDERIQREKMLYLNMLYDMVQFGIENGFNSINFGRTALEIKSSIGAEEIELKGYMQHANPIINVNLPWIFPMFEPKVNWMRRNPFKWKLQTSQLGIPHLDEAIKKKQGNLCQFFGS
jgi:hypothetical protein